MQKTNDDMWAGMKGSAEDVDIVEYAEGMGVSNETELRFMFDVPLASFCPSALTTIRIPSHFSKIFAHQWKWRHMDDREGSKCADIPFYNLYLAEAGFRTNLHVDGKHTSFTASMCQ